MSTAREWQRAKREGKELGKREERELVAKILGLRVHARLTQHKQNRVGWREPDGRLLPTEPDPDVRRRIRQELLVAITEDDWLLEQIADVTINGLTLENEARARAREVVEERKWEYAHGVPGLSETKRRHYCEAADDILAALEEDA